ncbi:MAG: DUF2461 domain-containing protein [Acidobacteria bacterium]|nr:DUF2461 domain-containing protein [Acidobacteriota bacterium]
MPTPRAPFERDPEPFEGFGPHALDFFERLEIDNTRAFWLANKAQYDAEIAAPMQALAAELAPRFGEPKVFRPYRDVRFSKDKTPYKTNAGLGFFGGAVGGFYLDFSPAGLMLAGGMWEPARDQLDRFRDLQDDEKVTRSLDALLPQLAAAGYPLGEGDPLKTAPRGRDKAHPRIEIIRRTRLTVSHVFEPAPWFFDRELLDRVEEGFATVARWNRWLAEHVGQIELPGRAW